MKITSILLEDSLIPELRAKDKKSVIRELSEAMGRSTDFIDPDQLVHILLEREKLGSTGIGSGVAIPHGKLSDLEDIVAGFGRSKEGIDFDSQDGEPTHLFFVLVAPENSAGLHLKALAKLSRLLKNPQFRQKLMEAPDRPTLFRAIQDEDEKT